MPVELHSDHESLKRNGERPVHEPRMAFTLEPSSGVPEIPGAEAFWGAPDSFSASATPANTPSKATAATTVANTPRMIRTLRRGARCTAVADGVETPLAA